MIHSAQDYLDQLQEMRKELRVDELYLRFQAFICAKDTAKAIKLLPTLLATTEYSPAVLRVGMR